MALRLITIGDAAVETAEGRIDGSAPNLFLATCYLAVPAGRRVPREELLELLWPDVEPAVRRHRLRTLLHRLKELGVPLEVTPSHVSVRAADVEADYASLRSPGALLADPALAEHVASILPFAAPVPRGLEEWIDNWRRQIAREVTRGIIGALQLARDRGDWPMVEQLAARCRLVDPFNEEAHLALAEALCMSGSKEQALKLLDEYVAELGSDRQLRVPVHMLRDRIAASDDRHTAAAEVPYVGRTELKRLLVEAFAHAGRGHGGARVVWGPAGIGKSRLLAEAAREVRLRGGVEARVACEPGDRERPLSVLFDLVPKLLDLPGALGCDAWVLEELRTLNTAADETDGAASGKISPSKRRLRIQGALLELLDAISAEQALVITVDDAQWMDPGLLPFWEKLLHWSGSHPVLWLFGCRAEVIDDVQRVGLGQLAPCLQVTVLDAAASTALIGRLASDAVSPAAQEKLAALGGGNPLVIVELVRHYIDTGGMEEIPMSVAALIGERLDRLSRTSVRVLQAAAILGAFASMERLEAMLALSRSDFSEAVYELASAGIVAQDAEGRVRAHALWSEAALARLQPVVASMLHRHAAERLEAELLEHAEVGILWECARHWMAAADTGRTLSALIRGAEHLAANGYTYDAALVYRRSVELSHDPDERLKLLNKQIDLLQVSGRWAEVVTTVEEHERLAADADPTHDPHNDLELRRQLALVYCTGDMMTAIQSALACALAPRAHPSHRVWAAKDCANYAEHMGFHTELIAAEQIVRDLPVTSIEDRRLRRMVKIYYHLGIGDPRIAAELSRERISHERASGDARHLCRAIFACHDGILLSGAVDEAWTIAREVVAIATRHGFLDHLKHAYSTLVMMGLEFEATDSARAWLTKLLQLFDEQQLEDKMFKDLYLPMYDAELALAEGDGERAREVAAPRDTPMPLPVPRWRMRFLSVHLGIALATNDDETAHQVGEEMGRGFDRQDRWLDWPASTYASYLSRFQGNEKAATFAQRYINEVRRELYPPPPRLLRFVKSSKVLAASAV